MRYRNAGSKGASTWLGGAPPEFRDLMRALVPRPVVGAMLFCNPCVVDGDALLPISFTDATGVTAFTAARNRLLPVDALELAQGALCDNPEIPNHHPRVACCRDAVIGANALSLESVRHKEFPGYVFVDAPIEGCGGVEVSFDGVLVLCLTDIARSAWTAIDGEVKSKQPNWVNLHARFVTFIARALAGTQSKSTPCADLML